jgi:eukaryotic-like serine/threonine-protein kinase
VSRHLGGLPVAARGDTLGYRTMAFVRRNRVAVAIATLALIAFAGAGASALWQARTARFERMRAERRFAEVRNLATSFLVELHDSIAPLAGSTPVRAMLVRRAVVTLDGLAAEASDDVSLQDDLASAYLRVGDVQGLPYSANLGDTKGALASYDKALAILRPLLEARPDDRTALQNFVVANQRLCTAHSRDGRLAKAIEHGREALAKSQLLLATAAIDSARSTALKLKGESHVFLGRAINQRRDASSVREALTHFEAAVTIREQLLAASPGEVARMASLASALASTGYAYWNLAQAGDATMWPETLRRLRSAQTIWRSVLVLQPTPLRRRNVADGLREIADVELSSGDAAAAVRDARVAMAAFDSLSAVDPANMEARRDVAVTIQLLGAALARTGDTVAAVRHEQRAKDLFDVILRSDASSDEDRRYRQRSVELLQAWGRSR